MEGLVETIALPSDLVKKPFASLPASVKTYRTSAHLHQINYWTWFIAMDAADYLRYSQITASYEFNSSQHPNVDFLLWTPKPLRLVEGCVPLHDIRVRGPVEEHRLLRNRGSEHLQKRVYISKKDFKWNNGGAVLVCVNPEQLWRWAAEVSVEAIAERNQEAIRRAKTGI